MSSPHQVKECNNHWTDNQWRSFPGTQYIYTGHDDIKFSYQKTELYPSTAAPTRNFKTETFSAKKSLTEKYNQEKKKTFGLACWNSATPVINNYVITD